MSSCILPAVRLDGSGDVVRGRPHGSAPGKPTHPTDSPHRHSRPPCSPRRDPPSTRRTFWGYTRESPVKLGCRFGRLVLPRTVRHLNLPPPPFRRWPFLLSALRHPLRRPSAPFSSAH